MVYVLNREGQPLMPTKDFRKVRHLLNSNEAKVVKRTPFTIKLLHGVKEHKQDVTLGIDAGSKTIGIAATTDANELFAAELKPRNDVTGLLEARRNYRCARRNRKTRYRQARFNNRVRTKHKGWRAPSILVKIHNHIQGIGLACKLVPVSKIIIETAEFDMQLLKSTIEGLPPPEGKDYQEGEMFGHYNTRQYIFWRDGYECQSCKGKRKETKLVVLKLDAEGTLDGKGGYAPNNLVAVCKKCADLIHKGKLEKPLKRKAPYRGLKDATFMGIMRDALMQQVKEQYGNCDVKRTIGAKTKMVRESVRLPKSRINDALCITGNAKVKRIKNIYTIKPVRRHNRQIHKATTYKGGYRKLNQAPKYVFGFQLFDRVRMPDGKEGFVVARRLSGSFRVRTLKGETLSGSKSHKKLKLLDKRKCLLVEDASAT